MTCWLRAWPFAWRGVAKERTRGETGHRTYFMKTKRQYLSYLLSGAMLAGALARCAWGGTATYAYDSAGRLTSGSYGVNTNISYAYDAAGNLLLASAPTPAILAAPQNGRQLTLYWPALPAGFVLQTSAALGPGASWSDVVFSQQPVQVGNLMVVTLSIGSQTAFYRLRH